MCPPREIILVAQKEENVKHPLKNHWQSGWIWFRYLKCPNSSNPTTKACGCHIRHNIDTCNTSKWFFFASCKSEHYNVSIFGVAKVCSPLTSLGHVDKFYCRSLPKWGFLLGGGSIKNVHHPKKTNLLALPPSTTN